MGGPMPQPPQKKSNVGMIVGIGCAGIFILLCGALGFSCWWAQKKAKETAAAIASAFPIDSTGKLAGDPFDLKPPTDGSLKLEAKDVRWFNSSSMVSVVAEIENTGTAPVSYPSVKFTFYDASKTAIDSGTGPSRSADVDSSRSDEASSRRRAFSVVRSRIRRRLGFSSASRTGCQP